MFNNKIEGPECCRVTVVNERGTGPRGRPEKQRGAELSARGSVDKTFERMPRRGAGPRLDRGTATIPTIIL